MKTIHLHGKLAKKFEKSYNFNIRDPAEGIRALCYQLPGFERELRAGDYRVVRDEGALQEEHFHIALGNSSGFHIVPVPSGAGNDGTGKIIAGIAIVAAAFVTGGGSLAATIPGTAGAVTAGNVAVFGVAIALGGVSQLLTPVPEVGDYDGRNAPDQRASFIANGAINVTQEGVAVPLVYGRSVRVGSVVVSSGLSVEQKLS